MHPLAVSGAARTTAVRAREPASMRGPDVCPHRRGRASQSAVALLAPRVNRLARRASEHRRGGHARLAVPRLVAPRPGAVLGVDAGLTRRPRRLRRARHRIRSAAALASARDVNPNVLWFRFPRRWKREYSPHTAQRSIRTSASSSNCQTQRERGYLSSVLQGVVIVRTALESTQRQPRPTRSAPSRIPRTPSTTCRRTRSRSAARIRAIRCARGTE